MHVSKQNVKIFEAFMQDFLTPLDLYLPHCRIDSCQKLRLIVIAFSEISLQKIKINCRFLNPWNPAFRMYGNNSTFHNFDIVSLKRPFGRMFMKALGFWSFWSFGLLVFQSFSLLVLQYYSPSIFLIFQSFFLFVWTSL